jgi:hypothetical protein
MQSITIGKPEEYLRLTAVRWPSDKAPEHLPRKKRRFVRAELRIRELTAACKIDLHSDYGGLVQFFDQIAASWPDWVNSSMSWGTHSPLKLELIRGPRPALGPDHFVLWIQLQNGGFRQRLWKVETSLILSPEELEAVARDLHALTD